MKCVQLNNFAEHLSRIWPVSAYAIIFEFSQKLCVSALKLWQSLTFYISALIALSGCENNLLMYKIQMQPYSSLLELRPLPETSHFPQLCVLWWNQILSSLHALRVPVPLKTFQKRHQSWCTLQYMTLLRVKEGGANWKRGRRIAESPSNSTELQEVANETGSHSSCVSRRDFTGLSRG